MKCEELFNEVLSKFNSEYIQKNFTTQCYRCSNESYIVINDNKKKVSVSLFFEATYEDDERIFADFIKVDNVLAWQLKTSESKVDITKIQNILMLILKGKHYRKNEKKYFAENMMPLFSDCNFEEMQKKYM